MHQCTDKQKVSAPPFQQFQHNKTREVNDVGLQWMLSPHHKLCKCTDYNNTLTSQVTGYHFFGIWSVSPMVKTQKWPWLHTTLIRAILVFSWAGNNVFRKGDGYMENGTEREMRKYRLHKNKTDLTFVYNYLTLFQFKLSRKSFFSRKKQTWHGFFFNTRGFVWTMFKCKNRKKCMFSFVNKTTYGTFKCLVSLLYYLQMELIAIK